MARKLTEEQVETRKRLIREYVKKNYSANSIQKELQKKGLGMRRKDLLREVRRFRRVAKKSEPEKYIPRKYRLVAPIKQIAVYGTVRGVSRRIEMYGTGGELYSAMVRVSKYPPEKRFVRCHAGVVEKYLDFDERWDEHPEVLS